MFSNTFLNLSGSIPAMFSIVVCPFTILDRLKCSIGVIVSFLRCHVVPSLFTISSPGFVLSNVSSMLGTVFTANTVSFSGNLIPLCIAWCKLFQ